MSKHVIAILTLILWATFSFSQHLYGQDISQLEKQSFAKKASFDPHNLSNNYDIVYHNIQWNINPEQHFISGKVESTIKILVDSANTFYFDLANQLQIDSITFADSLIRYLHENDLIKIQQTDYFAYGDTLSFSIYYQGEPSSSGFGAFETTFHSGTPIMWTLSEPYGAKEWWPCKQTLSDKIDSLDIWVTVPLGNKVASNGLLTDSIKTDSSISYHWKHRYPIATYLVAIAATNYVEFSDYAFVNAADSVKILNYVYPESYDYAFDAAKYTIDLIELFSEKLIPYPFYKEKYGHAQMGWSGGMEHQTMSFMGSFSKSLIAHELVHQWFGNHVTCGSWQDIWINEGFAVYGEALAKEYLHPNDFQLWIENRMQHLASNAKIGSVFVKDTTNINRLFDNTLSYQKGGMVLHQLRHQIGDEAFFNGLKNILNESHENNYFAKTKDIRHFFEEAADTNLADYFDQWIYGEGYPNFTIDFKQDDNYNVSLMLSQLTTTTETMFFSLYVPIKFINDSTSVIKQFHHTKNHQQFTFNPGFKVDYILLDPNYSIITKRPAKIRYEIDEILAKDKVVLTPNPSDNTLTLIWQDNIIVEKVEMYNLRGKRIYIEPLYDGRKKHTISVKRMKSGHYLVKIYTKKNVITKKFIRN